MLFGNFRMDHRREVTSNKSVLEESKSGQFVQSRWQRWVLEIKRFSKNVLPPFGWDKGLVFYVEVRIGKHINKHNLKTVIDGIRSYHVSWLVCEAVPSMWWVKRCCIHFWCMDLCCQFSLGFSSLVMLWMERSLSHPKICGLLAP